MSLFDELNHPWLTVLFAALMILFAIMLLIVAKLNGQRTEADITVRDIGWWLLSAFSFGLFILSVF